MNVNTGGRATRPPASPASGTGASSEEYRMADKHDASWRIPSENYPGEYGVLVRCGSPEHPYWWLLCPADATLYMSDTPDLRGCHMGPSCDHDDVHEAAQQFVQALK
jgi:hypothetical protein